MAGRITEDRPFENRHQGFFVAGQIHGLEPARVGDFRVVRLGEHQRVVDRTRVIGQFHRWP